MILDTIFILEINFILYFSLASALHIECRLINELNLTVKILLKKILKNVKEEDMNSSAKTSKIDQNITRPAL